MATLTAVVLDHHQKNNRTFNVKIRVSQKGKSVYIPTTVFADKRYIDPNGKLKDVFIEKRVRDTLDRYDEFLTPAISTEYSAIRIKEYLLEKDEEFFKPKITSDQIDFISFCQQYVDKLRAAEKHNSAVPLQTVTNSLRDYFGDKLNPSILTSKRLFEYEEYLKTDRVLVRANQFDKKVKTVSRAMSDAGVFKHMANLRLMFNACKLKYNDEDIGEVVIANNPFVKYKISPTRLKKKRNSDIETIIAIYNHTPTGSRSILAKEMFFISFALCGINAIDLHSELYTLIDGRLEYNRSKTHERRDDEAFTSIFIPDFIASTLEKYSGTLKKRFRNSNYFNKALNIGLKQIGEELGLATAPTFYHARHSFATIARNECRFSKDDVADALNHVDSGMSVTDGYLAKDWSIVDDVQSAVLKFFFDKLNNSL